MKDLGDYLDDSGHYSNVPCWWNYQFPSGRGANVSLGQFPFTFDVEVDPAHPDGEMETFTGLSSEQVREKLEALMAEPKRATP